MSIQPLELADLIKPDGRLATGLVPVHEPTGIERVEEASVIETAKEFRDVDYVFFRRFSDDRGSQAAAFVVDNKEARLSESRLAELHHELWLHGGTPLLYVAWPTRLDILSCSRGPDFWKNGRVVYNPADHIEIDSKTLIATSVDIDTALRERANRFSANRLADGTFWEDPLNRRLANHDQAAHQKLIQGIVETDQELEGEGNPLLRRLLVLTILVKYLEDRRVFPDDWFDQFHPGAGSFFEVLKGGRPEEVNRLLAALQAKFNGDVFALPGEVRLDGDQLERFATLVEARTLRRQRYLWEQYSFEHLPVEVISRIYQLFVQGGRGAVYTPPALASLLLDRALPYERLSGNEKILDPACGSGIFLVGAFKRLVNVWRHRNNWQSPDPQSLKGILKNSIYGVELHSGAIDLAAFSLALAVCDALKPNVIWNELQFDPLLGSNLREGDFFSLFQPAVAPDANWTEGFDVIIGNPPFESALTEAGEAVNSALERARVTLPDKQAAYLFLDQAFELLKPDGRLCLIQPSGLLYNRRTADFRRHLFEKRGIREILDFTSIRNLYDGADPKTIAVLADGCQTGHPGWVYHLTFRRTFSVSERIGFDLDHYERHRVPQQVAAESLFIWRANLLGGGRLYELSERLRATRTFSEFIGSKGWDYGEGFTVGRVPGRKSPAPFLRGKPLLLTDKMSDESVGEDALDIVRDDLFENPRYERLFEPPLMVIKEHGSLPIAFWDKGFLAYRDSVVGIHADPSQKPSLHEVFETFRQRRRLYQFCCLLHGSKALVTKATAILKQDIDALPYPEDGADLELAFWERALVDDVLRFMADFVRLGQGSVLLQQEATDEDLGAYSDLFCRMLGTVYTNLNVLEPIRLNDLICQGFFFGDHPEADWTAGGIGEHLYQLVYDQEGQNLRTSRIVRIYDKNVMILVKPGRLRYWVRSTAIRDADETLLYLRQQGY